MKSPDYHFLQQILVLPIVFELLKSRVHSSKLNQKSSKKTNDYDVFICHFSFQVVSIPMSVQLNSVIVDYDIF